MADKLFQKEVGGIITKADIETGTLEGVLIKGEVLDSYEDYFLKEATENFKTKNGSNVVFMLHQHKKDSEIGVMELYAEGSDLKMKARLDLSKDTNGNFINKEAAKIYSLMKLGAHYDLSVGGRVLKGEIGYVPTEKGEVRAYIIKEFEVWEGSLVVKGAVPGSNVTTFKNYNENEEDNMSVNLEKQFNDYKESVEKQIKSLEEMLKEKDLTDEMKKSVEAVKGDMEIKLKEYQEAFEKSIDDKLNDFAKEFKSIKETEKELKEADLEKSIMDFMKEVNSDTFSKKSYAQYVVEKATSTTSGAVPTDFLPLLQRTILRRAQEVKNIWAYISKFSMKEGSTKIPRETLGSTEVKFIGETAARTETTINVLDQVEIELHQVYALPIFTNKMLATDVVGFVALVLERVAENFTKKISEKILFGSGTGEPHGILNNSEVLANALTFGTTGEMDYETFTKAKYNLKEDYANRAIVIMNRKSAPAIINLKDKNDRPIFIEAYKDGKSDTISSLPVVYDDTMPIFDSANTGDVTVLIADMSRYLGATHTDYNIKMKDDITNKGFTAYYFETMVGGNVLLPEAFIPIKKK
ncbi:phage major capsid protein [Pseudoleptotrichia goodfellowii]|uniref:Phage major capsid protein, HK97 family n=1 Tax=Pseudoleptotrichia goodfellowii F0264 TaxID=596323 RepID=D0GNX9_9FUSO|nr:phage major capsid protein [Pseudoleptotrichia goodfellowii]EEY34214.1 phage major capsid protein, HK97 family [Pseudoleptotrichia goodfellowii F0264]